MINRTLNRETPAWYVPVDDRLAVVGRRVARLRPYSSLLDPVYTAELQYMLQAWRSIWWTLTRKRSALLARSWAPRRSGTP